jgi:hypothetical protein
VRGLVELGLPGGDHAAPGGVGRWHAEPQEAQPASIAIATAAKSSAKARIAGRTFGTISVNRVRVAVAPDACDATTNSRLPKVSVWARASLVILRKDDEGSLEAFEISDLDNDELGSLRTYEGELAMLLSEDDVTSVAEALEPGSTAGVLVWENTWAAPFGAAVRKSGGQLVASGRIPTQAILAALEDDEQDDEQDDENDDEGD